MNPLRAKQLYVLAALEVERYRKRTLDMGGRNATTTAEATAATLETLLKQGAQSSRSLACCYKSSLLLTRLLWWRREQMRKAQLQAV